MKGDRISHNGYVRAGSDVKCPHNRNTRLFRTSNEPLTLDDCHELCYDTEGCNYFSIGVTSHEGVCIGCTSEATLEDHVGFDAYELTTTQDFPTASPVAASSCLNDGDTFTTNGCDYESFIQGLDGFLAANECGDHDAKAVMESIFPNSSEDMMVTDTCADAWDTIDHSTFKEVDDRFTDDFMDEYINGDTFLNHETGTFQGTVEGTNIDDFRDDQATNTVVEAIPLLSTCTNNAFMCCFGRDRQPNDNNGNCMDPTDRNCRDADPADNSNLCWTDTNIPTFEDSFTFPGKSEGSIHCHGLAWGEDENGFEAQLRFNNLFYVSLYDHMYTRGYVETTVDSDNIGMCDCVENMPVVSRADCTQVDATQTFIITYDNGKFTASKDGDLDVQFNACQGINPGNGRRKDNDLGSYVFRLNQEGRINDDIMEGIYDTLVGYARPSDNQNEIACEVAYEETFKEEYPDDVANLKCPFRDGSERLFRTDNNDPLTLEECQELCYETQFCQYFSLGVSTRGDTNGVCIGCTASANLEPQMGFNAYEMTTTQTFPTTSPTPESVYFDAVEKDLKCPHSGRLFRTNDNEPLTRLECYQRCYDIEGCEYFSLGEDTTIERHKGVCMGCPADSALSAHVGFNAYAMETKQAFPTAAPTEDTFDQYTLVNLNKKCPSRNRIFRTRDYDPLTRNECYDKCNSDVTCEYFTFGEGDGLRTKWKGLCIGCSGGATFSDHEGFNTYMIAP